MTAFVTIVSDFVLLWGRGRRSETRPDAAAFAVALAALTAYAPIPLARADPAGSVLPTIWANAVDCFNFMTHSIDANYG